MRHLLVLACCTVWIVSSSTSSAVHGRPLTHLQPGKAEGGKDLAAEAMKVVGKEWTVEFTVHSTGQTRAKTRIFLNSEKDYRSERNLTIVLDLNKLKEDLKKAEITDSRKHFGDKKVRVTGKVSLYNKRPQIVVEKLEQIKLAK